MSSEDPRTCHRHVRFQLVRAAIWAPALVLTIMLVACAGTPEPTQPASSTPTPARPDRDAQPTVPAVASPSPRPSSPPPHLSPSPPTPVPLPAASPWPAFLREINVGIPVGNSYSPRALAVHPGLERIYARTQGQALDGPGRVAVLDRTNGQVLALVETGPDSYGEGDLAVDTEGDRVYVVNPGDASGSVFDAETLQPIATLQGVDHLALDGTTGRLYVAGLAGLRILDSNAYQVLRELPLPAGTRFLDLAVDPAEGRIYLAYRDTTGYVLGQYDATTLQQLAATSLLGQPDDLVPDPNRERTYVTLNDGERNLLWTLNGEGQVVEERILGEWLQKTHLALDPAGDRLFLGRDVYPEYGITVVALPSGQEMADIPLDIAPNSLSWDADAGRLLTSHTYADEIRLVDVEAGQTVALFPTARDLVDLAADPKRGHVYITDSAGELHILDSETDQELSILPGEGYLAADSPHGRLYTGGGGAKQVRVFDADALRQLDEIRTTAKPVADAYHGELILVQNGIYLTSLETMTVTTAISDTLPQVPGYSPNPAAVDAVVDAGSGRLFAIINNGTPGSNNGNYLYVYEPETYQKILTDTERSPIYMDVDAGTGRAYVSRIHLAGRSTSLLVDGHEYTARLDAVFGPLRVDPSLGRVYLTVYGDDEGYLLVLDAGNLDVLGSVPIPGGLGLRALDPQRHLLYLAAQDGRVQIWSSTGGELAPPAQAVLAHPAAEEIHGLFLGPGDTPLFTGSLYRSDDRGESWQRINDGLPDRRVQQTVVSPDFAHDATLFAVPLATDEGLGIWKSRDGGQSWQMANRGLSDLGVNGLVISPDYADDQTLFVITRRQGLFRSTDGGQSWIPLTERYHPSDSYPQPPYNVYLSPTYAQDQTVFVTHYGLRRSTDGGETWVRVLPAVASLSFSPEFATDRTVFGWSDSAGVLRSTDGGDTWQPASTGLSLTSFGQGRVIVSPSYPTSQTVYFIWTPGSPDAPAQFFRSTDAAATWEQLVSDSPQATTQVELSADGTAFVALDDGGRLVRWPVADMVWQAVTLPPLEELSIDRLFPSPGFVQDRTLLALSVDGNILRSDDAGLTWADAGFPLRTSHTTMLEILIVPPETLFVGTPLGLYYARGGGAWARTDGGLARGIAPTSAHMGADGSLRVLVSGEDEGDVPQVFLSTDSGQTWTQPIPSLPEAVIAEDLQFSPAFATDHAVFIAQSWDKPWRSLGGGEWQQFGPPGEWNLSAMQLSPAFHRDGLIFLRLQDNSLWRSSDAGDTWSETSGTWGEHAPVTVIPGMGYALDILTFSPAFAQDGMVLTRAGDALYRSTDRGTTWTRVLDLGPLSAYASFAPDYTHSGRIYLLQGQTLWQSTDRGQSWQALPPAPWSESDEVRLLLSPAFSQERTLLAWTHEGRVYQSQDGGTSWRDISSGLPPMSIRQVLFSPGYATDGLLYLVPFGPGLYKRVGDRPWTASTEAAPVLTPRASPTSRPTPPPTSTPRPFTCVNEPVQFRSVWQQAGARLGCPVQPAGAVTLAEQAFEHGRMIWDSSNRQIYVLMESGFWQAFDDTFVDGVDPAYDPGLPPPPQQPQRGFGKLWRQQLGGPEAAIGWGLEGERAVSGWKQPFDHGLLVWTDATLVDEKNPGTAYLLYTDGTWQAFAAQAP